MKNQNWDNLSRIFITLGYILLIFFGLHFSFNEWPIEKINTSSEDISVTIIRDYSLPKNVYFCLYGGMLFFIIGITIQKKFRIFNWIFHTSKKYGITYLTLILQIIIINIILITLFKNVHWKVPYVAMLIIASFLLFLLAKFAEEKKYN